jgi:hypothetical protein
LLKIEPSRQWGNFSKIYGSKDIVDRYQWFLFEFGKRGTKLFYKHLLQSISTIPGSDEYKKRLMIAEIRDGAKRSWWAIVASSKSLAAGEIDPKTSLLSVVSRFPGIDGDPVSEILESLGPWTVDTIPFLPSPRAGQVIVKQIDEDKLSRVADENFKRGDQTKSKMVKYGLPFVPRHVVYERLRVVRDLELEAIRAEFGLTEKAKPHWRPSLRWIKREGIRILEKDRDLIRVWVDPRFAKYRLFRHFRAKMSVKDLKRIQDFQSKVR